MSSATAAAVWWYEEGGGRVEGGDRLAKILDLFDD